MVDLYQPSKYNHIVLEINDLDFIIPLHKSSHTYPLSPLCTRSPLIIVSNIRRVSFLRSTMVWGFTSQYIFLNGTLFVIENLLLRRLGSVTTPPFHSLTWPKWEGVPLENHLNRNWFKLRSLISFDNDIEYIRSKGSVTRLASHLTYTFLFVFYRST